MVKSQVVKVAVFSLISLSQIHRSGIFLCCVYIRQFEIRNNRRNKVRWLSTSSSPGIENANGIVRLDVLGPVEKPAELAANQGNEEAFQSCTSPNYTRVYS